MPAFIEKHNIKWKKQPYQHSTINLEHLEKHHYPKEIPTSLDYFSKYFPDNEYQNIADYTNAYAEQTGKSNWVATNPREMKIFLGINLLMGVFKLSNFLNAQ